MLQNMPHIRHPYPYRYDPKGENLADRLEETILAYGVENVAAFIAEPISGSSLGAAAPQPWYWPRIREICDQYGVLLIMDEVLTGMGRTGRWWGIDHWEVTPDILVSSKGIAGGYVPFAAVVAQGEHVEEIHQSWATLTTAAPSATIRWAAPRRWRRCASSSASGWWRMRPRWARCWGSGCGRRWASTRLWATFAGCGLFWALEFVQDRETKEPFPKLSWGWRGRFASAPFDKGLIVYWSQGCADGQNGDLVMVGPPLIISEEQVDELVALLQEAVVEVLAEVAQENGVALMAHPNPAL
jgi:adenosylmethionine-8-amino-7-oxononanoate aminotransferase